MTTPSIADERDDVHVFWHPKGEQFAIHPAGERPMARVWERLYTYEQALALQVRASLGAAQVPAPAKDDAYDEAASLAQALFRKHFSHKPEYASGQVVWGLCDSTRGVISQIDNMVSGLVESAGEAQVPSLSDEQIDGWWRTENGLEDCQMCRLDDFRLVVRAVERKLAALSQPSQHNKE